MSKTTILKLPELENVVMTHYAIYYIGEELILLSSRHCNIPNATILSVIMKDIG